MTDQLLPHDLESERVVLGVVMIDPKAIHAAADLLKPKDFYVESHRMIFCRMMDLAEDNTPIDVFTLKAELELHQELDKAGGTQYLLSLTDGIPTAANLRHYARTVRERSISRSLIQLGQELQAECYQGEKSPRETLERIQAEMLKLYSREQERGLRSMADIVGAGFKELEDRSSGQGGSAVLTGFADIDRHTGGLRAGNLIVLAARPSIGKSALAVNIAVNAATREKKHTAIFSLEMSQTEIYSRMIAGEAGLSCSGLIGGYVRRSDWPRITTASSRLEQTPIWIDDSGSLSMLQMRARASRLKAEHGLDLIIVDYLQQVQGSGKSIYERVTEVSRSLKILAKDLEVPVLALSQLHRLQAETDEPTLSDLRESGAIEQDADMVFMLWKGDIEHFRRFKIAKQRNGPLATFDLGWIPDQTKFTNASINHELITETIAI